MSSFRQMLALRRGSVRILARPTAAWQLHPYPNSGAFSQSTSGLGGRNWASVRKSSRTGRRSIGLSSALWRAAKPPSGSTTSLGLATHSASRPSSSCGYSCRIAANWWSGWRSVILNERDRESKSDLNKGGRTYSRGYGGHSRRLLPVPRKTNFSKISYFESLRTSSGT